LASIEKTIAIIFEGVDKVGAGVTSATNQFNKLDAAVTAVADPLARVADGVLKVDAALAAMAAGALALAVDQASKFETSFNEIVTVSGATGTAIEKFKGDIVAYSQDSSKSIQDITDSVYRAISAGVDYSKSLDLLKVAEKLSVAGRAELKDTTLALVGTLNAYGASTDQAAKYSDILFTAVKSGQTTLPELVQSLSQVTGIAAGSKVPFETLAAAISALTASGLPTSQAITGIKQAIENIIKPTSEAEKAAAALGIQFNASALQTKGFDGVLKDVYRATGGNIDKMGELFGSVEGLNAVMVLAADRNGKFKDTLLAMKDATGATAAAYDIMAANFELSTQRLKNNVSVVLMEIGEKILPAVGADVNALSDVFKSTKFALDAGAFDDVFTLLNSAMAKLEAAFKDIAVNLPGALELVNFDDLLKSLKELGGSISEIFKGVDVSTPEGLAKAIQFVVDSITSLIHITDGMVEAFRPMIETIVNAVESYNSLDVEAQKAGGNVLGAAKMVVEAGVAIAAAVVGIASAGADLKGVFEVVIGSIQVLWHGAKMTAETIVLGVTEMVRQLVTVLDTFTLGAFGSELQDLQGKLATFEGKIKTSLISDAAKVNQDLGLIGSGFLDIASSAAEAATKVTDTEKAIDALPEKKETKVELSYEQWMDSIKKVTTGLDSIQNRSVTVSAQPDEVSFRDARRKLDDYIKTEQDIIVITQPDVGRLAETKKLIEENIPAEKRLQIQAELDKERIKAATDQVKAYFDFKAKVDVAQIEAAAKTTQAAFESINVTISTSGKLLDSLFGMWMKADVFEQGQIGQWIKQQYELQLRGVDQQEKLVNAQIKYLESKASAIQAGQAMIEIKGDGLAPELEAFMFKVLELVQVRVTEEHAEFLLGIGVA
jgi:TP901 family phage tail tape measure protein